MKKKGALVPEILEQINENLFQSQDPAEIEEKKEIPIPSEEATILPVEEPFYQPPEPGPRPIPSDLHLWTLPIPDDYNPKNDHSYNSLKYLFSLGYRDATWTLAESHEKEDACDDLNGLQFTTDWLLFAAQHDPPSPIYSRSHPDCRCFIACQPPLSYTEIPNDAPGLPIYATEDMIAEYKKRIFSNLFAVAVDAQTLAPPEDQPIYSYLFGIKKYAAEDKKYKWIEEIKPIKTTQAFRLVLPVGLYRPMTEEYEGIQVSKLDEMSQVYFPELNRIVQIPLALTQEIQLAESNQKPEVDMYGYVDENKTIGIITRILNNKIFCYIPDFDNIFEVTSFIPLTHS